LATVRKGSYLINASRGMLVEELTKIPATIRSRVLH